jgi:hypothetical protein
MKHIRTFGGKRYTYDQSFSHAVDRDMHKGWHKERGTMVRVIKASTYTSPKLAKEVNSYSFVIGDKAKAGSTPRWDMFIRRSR